MADFDLNNFVSAPTVEQLDKCRKDDLLVVAAHFNIKVSKQQLKREIKKVVVCGLRELGVLKLADSSEQRPGSDGGASWIGEEEASEIAEAEGSDAKAVLPPFDPFSPPVIGTGGDSRLKYRLAVQVEERERAAERKAQLDLQLQVRRMEIEADMQIRLRELELKAARDVAVSPVPLVSTAQPTQTAAVTTGANTASNTLDVSKHISLVPQFRESEVDSYFNVFERIASALNWPRDVWPLLLQCKLTGKAQEVCAALTLEDSLNYDVVKTTILRAYELVPEAYRQRFRTHKKSTSQTFVEFAREKGMLFDKWCTSNKVSDFQALRELILLEEFKGCIPDRVVVYLNEQKVTSLSQASVLADEFALTHKSIFAPVRTDKVLFSSVTSKDQSRSKNVPKPKEDRECFYCHKSGHLIADCIVLKRKQQSNTSKSVAFVKPVDIVNCKFGGELDVGYQPFVMKGLVSVSDQSSDQVKVTMLRDTGAMQSFIVAGALPLSEQTFCGTHVLVRGFEMNIMKVPLHQIYLKSDLFTGFVKIGVRDSLPVHGVSFILGNDIAGGKVAPLLEVCDKPVLSEYTDELSEKFPEVFPVCAVTRAQARKFADADDLSSTFMSPIIINDTLPVEEGKSADQALILQSDEVKLTMTCEKMITAQKEDCSLWKCFSSVVPLEMAKERKAAYFIENGLLMRWWCADVACDSEWTSVHQIVIPVCYRQIVLSLAHDHDLSGHLGVKKTYHRILKHFFWPRMKADVTKFCKTCQTCQFSGKPNQVIPRAPLVPIPVIGEPFEHVIVDCVGPLPKSKSGNQYLLTIMCVATRFPEAIPLRKITAPVISNALVRFFSMFGLPKVVQSDQGTNFLSRIFGQVLTTLNVSHQTSSAFHPESQGALERFHQTLKAMLRRYCMDTGKDWDEGIPLLLFAVREAVQDSLGFSPADLVFGHTVRGPLKMLKEDLLSCEPSTKIPVLDYVSKFRERLHKACSTAKESLLSAQVAMKRQFDRKTVQRHFKEGDQVLVLLPVVGSVLSARFSGPYEVIKKLSNTDYLIRTPERRKKSRVCHVNMLKEYHVRGSSQAVEKVDELITSAALICEVADVPTQDNDGVLVRHTYQQCVRLKNSEMLSNLTSHLSHLPDYQRNDVEILIHDFSLLFQDVPSRTTVLQHDIDVGHAVPIKQRAYRVNAVKRSAMKAEVEYLRENGLAKQSFSPWSSPCLLVTKSDGSARFCTDYRKVNSVTVPDSFPLPLMEDCVDNLGSAKFVSKLDLLKGYWQVPLTARASDISAFVTQDDFMQYCVMAFGMRNAPATFQRLINIVLAGVRNCNAYLDDLVIYSSSWSAHVATLREVFERLRNASLTLNLSKCEFGQATVTYLGREVGQGQVRPIEAKVAAIAEFPVPTTRKELRRFLGMAGYYRNFCKNFSTVASPLTSLLSPSRTFIWSNDCQNAFDNIKVLLCSTPVLTAPDVGKDFKLEIDASSVGAGAVLVQEDANG
ncbi:uncharacterized protein [Chanodichthys erythropterus]|uniref:uncharacterized protein n=1 Tax=Chanodichthys erythropterus TaxID=933992 RepID=UPI00351DD018